ncbi:MAG: twin-arginine translocation signal domain-containing protein [Candidatus Woesearchaeota archaeon]
MDISRRQFLKRAAGFTATGGSAIGGLAACVSNARTEDQYWRNHTIKLSAGNYIELFDFELRYNGIENDDFSLTTSFWVPWSKGASAGSDRTMRRRDYPVSSEDICVMTEDTAYMFRVKKVTPEKFVFKYIGKASIDDLVLNE